MGLQIDFMIHRLTRPGRKALTRSGAVAVVVSSGDARLGRRTVGAMREGESAVLDHTNHIFSESSWSKDIKTDITKCLIHKYTNTNTQIHKYTNTQIQHITKCGKDQTNGIFLKRGLFKGIKYDIPMC